MNHQIALAVSKIILIWKWIWRHFWFDPSIDYNRTGIEIYYFDSGGSNSLKLGKKRFFLVMCSCSCSGTKYNFWLCFVNIIGFFTFCSTVNFILPHLCFGEWSQKSSPNFFPFKKEISCWAFLSYSCQNWGCGLFNLCTWSLLISWKICKMLFLSNLWGNNLKKVKLFLNLCQRCWDICKCFEKKS